MKNSPSFPSIVDTDLPGYREPGLIGLQIHPNVKMKVEFRRLHAKEPGTTAATVEPK